MTLTPGKKYYYWNRKVNDNKPTKKVCKLIVLSKDGKYATVERADLSVNKIQKIEVSRLREIANEVVSDFERLF